MSLLNDLAGRGQTVLGADAALLTKTWDVLGDFAVNLTVAVAILAAAIFLSRWVAAAVERALLKLKPLRKDKTLADFFSEVARWAVLIVGVIAVLQRLGVQTASIIAVLGAASLAIGLALRGTLSDLAAGVMLLVLRPYRVGDTLEVQGHVGKVRRLDLFNTELCTNDNRKVVIPNSKALSDPLVNRTGYAERRVDVDFDIHYNASIDHAFEVMRRVAEAEPRVLDDRPVWTGVTALKDSSVLVQLQAWVKSGDWFEMRSALLKAVKEAFDREGIVMPYPHQVAVMDPDELREQLNARADAGDEPAPAH